MPTSASDLTDEILDAIEAYLRTIASGAQRPKGLPKTWLQHRWPGIPPRSWTRWLRLGREFLSAEARGQLDQVLRGHKTSLELGLRCMGLFDLVEGIELASVARLTNYVWEFADDDNLDPNLRLKASIHLLQRLEPGRWTNSGSGADSDESEAEESAGGDAWIDPSALDSLSDEQRAAVMEKFDKVDQLREAQAEAEAEIERLLGQE